MLKIIMAMLFPVSLLAQARRFEFTQNKMGSPFQIIFYCDDSLKAVRVSNTCFMMVDSLNKIFSDYDTTSEITKVSRNAYANPQKISGELMHLLQLSSHAYKNSEGAFDISIGNLSQLWRYSKKQKIFPSPFAVDSTQKLTGFHHLLIDTVRQTLSFMVPGIKLDFGGIVKGYAAQKVVDYLLSQSIVSALADAGGDIAISNAPPQKDGWLVAVNVPESATESWKKKLTLHNKSVATSGDVYQYTLHEGKKYSHIINPETGYGITSQRNVTVIAGDGATADWLATACSILPIRKSLRLAKKQHAALMIAYMKNERIAVRKTKNFDLYFTEQ